MLFTPAIPTRCDDMQLRNMPDGDANAFSMPSASACEFQYMHAGSQGYLTNGGLALACVEIVLAMRLGMGRMLTHRLCRYVT